MKQGLDSASQDDIIQQLNNYCTLTDGKILSKHGKLNSQVLTFAETGSKHRQP